MDDARAMAAKVLYRVIGQGYSLSYALSAEPVEAADRAMIQELSFGVMRWHERLARILAALLHTPLRRRDLDVECLLKLGLYQLLYMRVPAYAAVNGTVQASKSLGKSWASNLVNAALRNFIRRKSTLLTRVDQDPTAKFAHPRWLLKRLQSAYPQGWEGICLANNQHPPMSLRVNQRRKDIDCYVDELRALGYAADRHPVIASAVVLQRAIAIDQLPGFRQGIVSVQDGAAQLAAPLLDCRPGMRVLDACAAPGGKTAHILESVDNQVDLLALEADATRIQHLKETLERTQTVARIDQADAARPEQWWNGRAFDRILLDAPCSGSGVIRRHPDIKLLRRASDIHALQHQQYRLLNALWPLVAEEGILLYVTCSVFPEENNQLIQWFLREHLDAELLPTEIEWMDDATADCQILPGQMQLDGFYYARLYKSSSSRSLRKAGECELNDP